MAQVYGIHQIELTPDADRAAFERRMAEAFIPKIRWTGWGAALVRASSARTFNEERFQLMPDEYLDDLEERIAALRDGL